MSGEGLGGCRGSLVCGEVIEADSWCGVGEFRWRCGACQGLRERQEARLAGAVIPGNLGRVLGKFEIPRSRRAGRQQRPRASRFRGSGALAVVCGISRAEARTVTRNFEPLARK